MMAKAVEASAVYENPLIPNARMRQIYLAMMRARMLEKALPAGRRGRVVTGGPKGHAAGTVGMEACLVSPSADLRPGDLVSDALAGGVVEFLRGATLATALLAGKVSRKDGVVADCGAAARLPDVSGIAERLWAAVGAAAALKATAAKEAGVVVAYVRPGEVPAAVWRKLLEFAAEQVLPILFVVMPAARGRAAAAGVGALALRCGVPGIAVDGDDAVAIYRVAQESIGRARIGGGAAVIECVPFVVSGAKGKRGQPSDAIAAMEGYLLQRGVVKQAWMDRESRIFAQRLAAARKAAQR
jgi:TPP-dependent pyruvate/acetoin dehydrogenase alpha subunit